MPQHAQRLAWPFSSYHGKNIKLLNQFIAKASYGIAHGQILVRDELRPGQTFDLDIRGKGIIKIGAFPTKKAAELWVHSRSPLGKGSIRIRTRKLLQFKISVPTHDEIVLSTKDKHKQNHLAGSVLAFDIEYGDLFVMVLNRNSNNAVQFDTSCHSRHIEVVNSSKICHANLHHYNPTSLCTAMEWKLSPGQLFKLEVLGPDDPKQTGSYVRVCVSGACNEYSNKDFMRCEGTRDSPECKGKRLMIRPGRTEAFVIRVAEDGVCVERGGDLKCFIASPITRCDLGLWFEMHRVEMRLWLLRAKRDGEPQSSCNDEPPPPDYPAPPPPRRPIRRDDCLPAETDCWRSTGQRSFPCQHALGESSSLSSDDSCRYISIQRDDTDISSYVTVDNCDNDDCSAAPDSDETYTAGMFGSETATPAPPPPLPPRPCTGRLGGQNQCTQRWGEPCLQDFGYVPMRRPTQERSERCSSWVSRQTPPTPCLSRRTTDNGAASSSEDSSYFIHYSRPSLMHELALDFPGEIFQGTSPQDDESPDSPIGSFLSMSSFSSEDFGLSPGDSLGRINEAPEAKPVPCFSKRQRNSSLESTSECSEMSIDEETDRKTFRHHKSSGAASSYESKSEGEIRDFFWNPLLQPQSSTESETEETSFPHPFLDKKCKENELSKDDIVFRTAPPTFQMRRNIVESSIINASQDSSTATVEDGPICVMPKSEMLDRSSTIKRNLNDEVRGGAKHYNSK